MVKVVVQHAMPLVAAGLRQFLEGEADLALVAGEPGPADVLITDQRGVFELLGPRPRPAGQRPRVVVVAASDRERDVRLALERGAFGYLLLDCSRAEVLQAVRSVARGLRWLCPAAVVSMTESLVTEPPTAREEEVLGLLAAGCSNKVIAQRLGLALGTVKAHMKSLLHKLGASSRTEAISIAVRRGLADVGQAERRRADAPARVP